MALLSSGSMSFGGPTIGRSINLELGRTATSTLNMNDADARTLAGRPTGNISVSEFYGKEFFVYGQEEFTSAGTFDWVCPNEVTSISVVVIGGGGGGNAGDDFTGVGGGGGGGALAYRNNVSVIPGQTYQIIVGSGGFGQITTAGTTIQEATDGQASSAFSCIAGGGKKGTRTTGGVGISSSNAAGGAISGVYTGGNAGGTGGTVDTSSVGFRGPGGGGAAGYSGVGGAGARGQRPTGSPVTSAGFSGAPGAGGGGGGGGSGYTSDTIREADGGNGGGVGIYGQGTNGAGGAGGSSTAVRQDGGDGSDGFSGLYGGGGGGGVGGSNRVARDGMNGAVRLVWPGIIRQFPSTRTANE